MVVDSSALVAIFNHEPERVRFIEAILAASPRLISAATLLETSIVLAGRIGPPVLSRLEAFLAEAGIEVAPFDAAAARLAADAFLRFGKGRHPAALNMGDCAAYALAKARGLPLLYKGADFARTDIRAAL